MSNCSKAPFRAFESLDIEAERTCVKVSRLDGCGVHDSAIFDGPIDAGTAGSPINCLDAEGPACAYRGCVFTLRTEDGQRVTAFARLSLNCYVWMRMCMCVYLTQIDSISLCSLISTASLAEFATKDVARADRRPI